MVVYRVLGIVLGDRVISDIGMVLLEFVEIFRFKYNFLGYSFMEVEGLELKCR